MRWPDREHPRNGQPFTLGLAELAELLEHPPEARGKDGQEQWAFASFENGHRRGSNLRAVFALALDGDACRVGLEMLDRVFDSVCWAGHTSWSHTERTPRWRAVLPLSRPCSAFEVRMLARWARRLLPGLDELPPSQAFYLPARRPGYRFRIHEGPPLDVDSLLPRLAESRPPPDSPWRRERDLAARRIVAAAIHDPGLVAELDLEPSELPSLALCEVYEWIKRRVDAGERTALLDVTDGSALPRETIDDLIENVFVVAGRTVWPEWVETLRAGNRRATVIAQMHLAAADLERAELTPDDAVARLASMPEPADSEIVSVEDSLPGSFEHLMKIQAGEVPGRIPTGFVLLDDYAPGPGHVAIIGARTSVGKSQLALQIARNLDAPSLFCSAEMSIEECDWRLLAAEARVPVDAFRRPGGLRPDQIEHLRAARETIKTLPIRWATMIRPERICSAAARLQRSQGIKVLFVDYLQRLSLPRAENRNLEVQAASRMFKDLAAQTGLVVYLLSQVRRPGRDAEKDPPRLSDLRDSGSLEQDADLVVLLHREPFSEDLFVGIAKNRHGRRDELKLKFIGGRVVDDM
ncbi:MAG: DnaB-like helicase C-terminal domain-containing protein [Deltaproteobacteria bacterium]|nr:DnaB-like helicase C-terminal domain-containing protein [Deltaproteobacteria bacterium]